MKFKISYTFALIFILGIQTVFSQKKDENIGTEVVNVVKPYTPTISDAFKVKETPPLEDEDNTKKKDIKYNIFSFPVASTFAPSKGRAANVDKTPQARLFKNFATVGLGNYGTANAELFVTENVGETGYVGGMLRHLSSNGGIENVELDNSYNNSSADLTYGNKTSNMSFNIDLGYQNQGYNWYGLPDDFGLGLTEDGRDLLLGSIDPQHVYHNAYAGGKIGFNESIFNEMAIRYNRFWDAYGSEENRFYAKPIISFDINNTKIKTKIIADYVGGKFDETLESANLKYGFANFGIHPSFNFIRNDWSLIIGAAAFFSMDLEQSDNKIFIYPQVTASYNIVGDLMIFYAGAEGTLQQNSYRDFTNENPYMAPALDISPTDQQFDVYGGLKGRLASSVSYNLRASMISERDRAFIRAADYNSDLVTENYGFGNSFGVVYDDMRTLSFFGELKADFSKNVAFGVNATYSKYDTFTQEEAWNLPELKISSSLEVNIGKKWFAGANVFFVGERKDMQHNLAFDPNFDGIFTPVTLDSYFDANLHLGYNFNDRLTFFLKGNNIANQMYEKWLNYPVQGIQVLGGASYKFDF